MLIRGIFCIFGGGRVGGGSMKLIFQLEIETHAKYKLNYGEHLMNGIETEGKFEPIVYKIITSKQEVFTFTRSGNDPVKRDIMLFFTQFWMVYKTLF